MTKLFVTIVCSFLLASCAATLPFNTNYPLTETRVRSRDGVLTGKIPGGWYSGTEDSLANAATLVLIREDASAILAVKQITLDVLAAREIEQHGIVLLAGIDSHDKAQSGAIVTEPQEFEIHGTKFCSFEATENAMRSRTVVFQIKGKYYECEARGGKAGLDNEAYNRIFTAQQAFLSSLLN